MNAPIIRPDTCQTCPFKVRKGQKLECHGGVPTAQAIIHFDDQQARVVGCVTIWPEVQEHDFCAQHPKRRLAQAEVLTV